VIPRRYLLLGLGAVLAIFAATVGFDSCYQKKVTKADRQANTAHGEADVHQQQAQAVPDHAAELAQAKTDVAGARAEVEKLRRIVAAQRRQGVPDPVVPDPAQPVTVEPDHRDELLAADAVLIAKLDDQVKGLQLALTDEQKRSFEWKATAEAREREAVGLRIALDAQKHVSASGKWVGRFQGLAVGLAGGYIAGRLR
jgi:hypothetical protein